MSSPVNMMLQHYKRRLQEAALIGIGGAASLGAICAYKGDISIHENSMIPVVNAGSDYDNDRPSDGYSNPQIEGNKRHRKNSATQPKDILWPQKPDAHFYLTLFDEHH